MSITRRDRWESQRAFTLLEICLVLFLVVLILGVTVAPVSSLFSEERTRCGARELQVLAKTARRLAMAERRAYEIRLKEAGFSLLVVPNPQKPHPEKETPVRVYAMSSGVEYRILPWEGEMWKKPKGECWVFQPTGLCKPMKVQFIHGETWLELEFDPLTAGIENEAYYFP